ncbi:MAG: excinuclease ABC subunit UvrC [Deltaproteobacteria bacterium]|nr:excinuclease ABC subunit UvrC [Deltaproteobacteria bacterium]
MTTRLRDAERAPEQRSLKEILTRLPSLPGVYLMKDVRGKILYIGKAANLKNRVAQYFQPNSGDTRDFVPLLGGIVADIDTVVTGNEKEALLLENTLIKQHHPKFNIKLRDDSSYLVLRIDPKSEWPRLEVVRRLRDDGAWYFGPYHSASACREALRVVNRHFQLRTCTDHVLHNRKRPCLQYQIKRCPAPCVLDVPTNDYTDQVRDVRFFLDGKSSELTHRLRDRMRIAASDLQYERAATLRDQLAALEKTLQGQSVVSREFVDQDAFGFHRDGVMVDISVLSTRDGKLMGSRNFSFGNQEFPDGDVMSSFLSMYYDMNPMPPDEILLPFSIPDAAVQTEWLQDLRRNLGQTVSRGSNRAVRLFVPARGPRHDRVTMANQNASANHTSRRNANRDALESLAKLQQRLQLNKLPKVIECYDISHVQGTDTVASQVVFVDGQPEKNRYRTYKLRHLENAGGRAYSPGSPDDFAGMYEVLSRRLRRAREGQEGWALPDLILVDGGKGQLGMALAAARDIGIDVGPSGMPIVGLAKDPDRVFLPNAKDGIPIRSNSAELFIMQQLRDEAHRFAVGFHRSQRRRRTLRSALGTISGVGPTRQKQLLRHFGSVKGMQDATVDTLAAVKGMSRTAALAVREFLDRQAPAPMRYPEMISQDTAAPESEDEAINGAFAALETPEESDESGESDESE